MKRLFIWCFVSLFLASCASYRSCYQVFTVVPENASLIEKGLPVFKTDDGLVFTYDFWGQYGKMRFIAYNSNDYDVIVDLTRSSFIRNTIAEDYYQGKQIEERSVTGLVTSSNKAISSGYQASVSDTTFGLYDVQSYGVSDSYTAQKGVSLRADREVATIYTEPKEVRIPARSAKVFQTFDITKYMIPEIGTVPNMVYAPKMYTKQSTPLIMRNRICVYKEDCAPIYHSMDFYIGQVGNVESVDGLVSPVNFFIVYPTKEKSIDNRVMQVKPEELRKGDEVVYRGVKCIVVNVDDINVSLAACDETKRDWQHAVDYCKSLGDGWLLPSKSMLYALGANINNINRSIYYWTNKTIDDTNAEVYGIINNVAREVSKTSEFYTLAITTISLEEFMKQ